MNILVDSNILIDYLRRDKKPETIFYGLFSIENTPAISCATITELYAGKSVEERKERQNVERVINACQQLEISAEICKSAGELLRRGQGLTFQDALIAATALHHKLPLLTLNKKHFNKIKGVTLFPY